jgi:hypothetical protein
MPFTDRALLESAALFAGVLLCLELGRRLGRRTTAGEAEGANPGDRGGGRRPPTERPRDDGVGIVGAKFDVRHFDDSHRGHVHASAGNYFRDAFPPGAGLRLPRRPGHVPREIAAMDPHHRLRRSREPNRVCDFGDRVPAIGSDPRGRRG